MPISFFEKKHIDILKISFIFLFSLVISFQVHAETVHEVKKGETLYSISRKYELTLGELRTANNLSENSVIKVGQKLTIPNADIENAVSLSGSVKKVPLAVPDAKTEYYIAQKGDTFYGISRKYNIKVAELFALNGLSSDSVLKVGQKIKVPSEKSNTSIKLAQIDQGSTESQKEDDSSSGDTKKENLPDIKGADPRKYKDGSALSSSIVWPVKNPKVTYVSGKVSGVLLTAASKENVTNIMAGTVMYCGAYRGFGEVVFIQSKTGLIYAYTGLSTVKVKKGAYVVTGDVIGKAGLDPITKESQLILMVFRNGTPIDPAKAPRG